MSGRRYRAAHARQRPRRHSPRPRWPPGPGRGRRGPRASRLHDRRPRRCRAPRGARARARGAAQQWVRSPCAPHHGEPRPGGRAEGGLCPGPRDRDRHPRRLGAGHTAGVVGAARGARPGRGGTPRAGNPADGGGARAARGRPCRRALGIPRRGSARAGNRDRRCRVARRGRRHAARPPRGRAPARAAFRDGPRGAPGHHGRGGGRRAPGPRRRARPLRGAARPRDRPGGGSRARSHRPPRVREDDARLDDPGDPPAARRPGGARGHDHRVGGGIRASPRPRPPPAVPGSPPHRFLRGSCRGRAAPGAGRGDAGPRARRSGVRPFGYRDDFRTAEPTEAAAIREAVARILAGDSLRGLANDWNARGIRTVRGYQWSARGLRQLLLAPRLSGQRAYHGEVVAQGDWEAILTPEQTARLAALLTDPARTKVRTQSGATCSRWTPPLPSLRGRPGRPTARRWNPAVRLCQRTGQARLRGDRHPCRARRGAQSPRPCSIGSTPPSWPRPLPGRPSPTTTASAPP